MLKRENRLVHDSDFKIVFAQGKYFTNRFLVIKYHQNNLEVSRFGIIISSKVSKKAVERNRVKRQIREMIRNNLSSFKKGYDIVIIVKKDILSKNFQEISSLIIETFKSRNLYENI